MHYGAIEQVFPGLLEQLAGDGDELIGVGREEVGDNYDMFRSLRSDVDIRDMWGGGATLISSQNLCSRICSYLRVLLPVITDVPM